MTRKKGILKNCRLETMCSLLWDTGTLTIFLFLFFYFFDFILILFLFFFSFLFIFLFWTMKKACDTAVTWHVTWCDVIGLEHSRRIWKIILGHIYTTWWPWVRNEIVVATTRWNSTCDMLTSAKLSLSYLVVGITRELDKEPSLHCFSIYINTRWSMLQQYVYLMSYYLSTMLYPCALMSYSLIYVTMKNHCSLTSSLTLTLSRLFLILLDH